jgi:hypothetical protein
MLKNSSSEDEEDIRRVAGTAYVGAFRYQLP